MEVAAGSPVCPISCCSTEIDMLYLSQGPLQKIWDLNTEIAASEVKISVRTVKLEKEKAKKKALQRALAKAYREASKM